MSGRAKPVLEIDGDRFHGYEGFCREFSMLLSGHEWRGNLNAFNDILRGGFGTPKDGFVLRWLNSAKSREDLGWIETVSFLERKLTRCHPTNRESVGADIDAAKRGEGQTLFDLLVEIIRYHGPGGDDADSNVDLELV